MGAWVAAMGVGKVGVQAPYPHGRVEQQGPIRVGSAVGLRAQIYQAARMPPAKLGDNLSRSWTSPLHPTHISPQSKDPQSRPYSSRKGQALAPSLVSGGAGYNSTSSQHKPLQAPLRLLHLLLHCEAKSRPHPGARAAHSTRSWQGQAQAQG